MYIICELMIVASSLFFRWLLHIGGDPYSQLPMNQLLNHSPRVHFWWNEVVSILNHNGTMRYAESYKRSVSTQWLISWNSVNWMDIYASILISTTISASEKIDVGMHMSWVAQDTLRSIHGTTSQLPRTIYFARIKCSQIMNSGI